MQSLRVRRMKMTTDQVTLSTITTCNKNICSISWDEGYDEHDLRQIFFGVGIVTQFIIAFVGLMIAHIVRPFFGITTARLLISAGLVGGCFLIWVDVIARTIVPGQEIPIGVITSVVGSVFFLFLMRKAKV